MAKQILTIGFELAAGANRKDFTSKVSLLDWDIVLFQPEIDEFTAHYTSRYQGKPSLGDTVSFQLKEACEHWRREIKQAVETGKTVLAFLPPVDEVYIDTGDRTYSGTGRNQKTTRIVDAYTNYKSLPISLAPVSASGSSMKLTSLGTEILASYWKEFGSLSEYKVLLSADTKGVSITTKIGEKPVGAIIRSQISSGALVLLPEIDFSPANFFKNREDKTYWTPEAKQFALRFISAVVALDKALHTSADVTPEPTWATDRAYVLNSERTLRAELLDAERQVEEAQKRKEDFLEKLRGAGQLRALLYEKGKPLENAIIEALRLMGFKAASYKQADSEFDVVFESIEGRLLGEAEGRDSKAINVDKLRQLAMNIHEDLQRDDVNAPAKGVLFGNGFRLTPPIDRESQFTDKCIVASQASATALITTSNLYTAAQYLSDQKDDGYAKQCREAMLKGFGPVTLPQPPTDAADGPDVSEEA
jgi:hypothetical protein